MLRARFDGGCWPNPGGHAACACLIEQDGEEVYRESVYLGFGKAMTSNVAEYRGLRLVLNWFRRLEPKEPLHIVGDAQIVVNRMKGKSRKPCVGMCTPLALECEAAARPFKEWLTFEWQRRENNDECDAMCDLEIDEAKYAVNLALQ